MTHRDVTRVILPADLHYKLVQVLNVGVDDRGEGNRVDASTPGEYFSIRRHRYEEYR